MGNTSSIGHDIEYDDWLEHYASSKFCLSIRGDSPHSHALIRSVKFGCIPVVISDFYSLYSPTFNKFVAIEDYSVMLDEKAFLEDPVRELRKLDELSDFEIQEKIRWLQFAQRIFFVEHPESLFVPAFISQALHASNNPVAGPEFVQRCNATR